MINHNYIADLNQYPPLVKTEGYASKEAWNDRFKKTATERAEIFAARLSSQKILIKEYGPTWKIHQRQSGKPFREFNKTIQSGAKIIAQWN